MRERPVLAVAQTLTDAGVEPVAYDPQGMEQAQPMMPHATMSTSPYAAIEGADAIVLVTE